MATPPNLSTTHQDNVGEKITAAMINDIATFVNGINVLNAVAYGADSTGVADSSAAIQSAINALPTTGGIVYIPAGNYKINSSSVNIGNGSSSALSTRTGVMLVGAGPAGYYPISIVQVPGVTIATTRLFGSANPLVQINGPLNGWGVQNMVLDGTGSTGLAEYATQGGDCRNLIVANCTTAQLYFNNYAQAGGLSGVAPNRNGNHYTNMLLALPDANFARGILYGVSPANTNDSWANTYDNISIFFPRNPTAGRTYEGIHFRDCDDERYRDVQFSVNGMPAGGHIYGLRYDYTGVNAGWPADCVVNNVDLGGSTIEIVNDGTPTNASPNRVLNISGNNGIPNNPLIANLNWEGVRAKAGAVVAADIPAGQAAVIRDTTNNTTKLYYNNAGTLISVALA